MPDAIDALIDSLAERATRRQQAGGATVRGAAGPALQGLTFGFGDELTAGVRSLFGSNYDEALGQERAALADYRERHPALAMGAEVAGSLPTLLIPGLGVAGQAAARGAQVGGAAMRALRAGAAAGAAGGALQGFGEGEGGITQRAMGAGVGGAVGGVAGGAGGAALEGARAAGRGAREWLQREAGMQPGRQAAEMAARAIERDRPDGDMGAALTDSIIRRRDQATAGMPDTPETLAEVSGPNALTQLEALAQQPGEAMTRVTRQMTERGEGRMNRVDQALVATFGDVDAAYRQQQRLFERRRQEAAPAFAAALDNGTPPDAETLLLLQRVPPAAYRDAREIARMREGQDLSFNIREREDGGVDFDQAPSLRDIHRVLVGLSEYVTKNTDDHGHLNGLAAAAVNLRDQLRGRLDRLTVDDQGRSLYAEARRLWAEPTQQLEALQMGQRLFREAPERLRETVGGMSEPERWRFVEGGMSALRDSLGRVRTTGSANPINAIAGSARQRQALQVLAEAAGLSPEDAATRYRTLAGYLQAENAGHQAEGQLLRNSRTAARQAAMGDLAAAGAGASIGGAAGYLAGGDTSAAGMGALAAGAGGRYLARRGREAATDRLAAMLGATDPAEQRQALRLLQEAQQRLLAARRGLSPNVAARAGLAVGAGPGADEIRRGLLD
jgi:hypothetical protein